MDADRWPQAIKIFAWQVESSNPDRLILSSTTHDMAQAAARQAGNAPLSSAGYRSRSHGVSFVCCSPRSPQYSFTVYLPAWVRYAVTTAFSTNRLGNSRVGMLEASPVETVSTRSEVWVNSLQSLEATITCDPSCTSVQKEYSSYSLHSDRVINFSSSVSSYTRLSLFQQ